MTLYVAILGIDAAQSPLTGNETAEQLRERIEAGSPGWFMAGLAVACILVVVGAVTGARAPGDRIRKGAVVVRVLLAAVAFTFWTSALPGSWPYSWSFVRDLGVAYVALLIPIGLAVSATAEWVLKKNAL